MNEKANYRPELDSLRTVAVTIVLLHHYIVDRSFVLSGFGVMLFFVLSGYFGTRSLLRFRQHIEADRTTRPAALKVFYARRYLRILPVHLLVLGVTALANVEYARATLWWNAPFLANLGMLWHDEWFGRFSPLWSLAVLEQFYLWWPAAILWVPRARVLPLIVAVIAGASAWRLACLALSLGDLYWVVAPFAMVDCLGFGALLALARSEPSYARLLQGLRTAGAWPCGLVLAALVALRISGGAAAIPHQAFWVPVVGSVFFVWLTDKSLRGIGGTVGRWLRHPGLAGAGALSYSVFLLHNFTELLVPPVGVLGAVLHTDWQALVLIPCTFALAHAVSTCIEAPIARIRRSRFRMDPLPNPAEALRRPKHA